MSISETQKWCDTPEKLGAYIKAVNKITEEFTHTLNDIGFESYDSLWSPTGPIGIEVKYKDESTEFFKGDMLEFIKSKQ